MWLACEIPHVEIALIAIRLYIVIQNCKVKSSMTYIK